MSQELSPQSNAFRVVHVTNLGDEEYPAFVHAVALARAAEGSLLSLHANGEEASLASMPAAEPLLERWEPESERTRRFSHKRVVTNCCEDAVDTLIRAVEEARPDLLVAATAAREGVLRVLFGSVAESLAREISSPTLFVPISGSAFASADPGELRVQRILVAAGDAESARVGAARATWLVELAGARDVEVELLHVGAGAAPDVAPPAHASARFSARQVEDSIDEGIVSRANELGADLIIMATRGHDSLGDMLSGSHVERVLHHAPCPVLSVPLR